MPNSETRLALSHISVDSLAVLPTDPSKAMNAVNTYYHKEASHICPLAVGGTSPKLAVNDRVVLPWYPRAVDSEISYLR